MKCYVLLTDSFQNDRSAYFMQGILSFNLSIFFRSVKIIKMIRDSREEELLTKQGGTDVDKFPVSSRLWSALKNPRIVRVSRTFGGKDRHSKVRTIRGLRDRRVRLSVPTAIQLYDLQDKLGVNQPSKVVDWLLNAAQHEIDKLPPLQMPPGNFIQFPQSMAISYKLAPPQAPSFHPSTGDGTEFIHDDRAFQLASSSSVVNGDVLDNNTVQNAMMVQKSTFWNSDILMKNKEAMKEPSIVKGSMIKGNDAGSTGLQNNDMPYPSYHHWDPSNAHVSYLGSHSSQADGFHNYQPVSMFASYMNAPTDHFNAKQYKHLHLDNSASQLLPSNSLRNSLQSGDPSLELLQPNLAFKLRHPQDHQD